MTPEQQAQFTEMYAWFQARKQQQLSFPVDDASKNALGVLSAEGNGGATLTRDIALTGNAQNITVPAAYTDTLIILFEGGRYEVPIL